ncbi:DNA recombination protein RecN [Micromonospora sp. NPDC001898]|uniref:DNA recombination protein RecN n=1 Tax=Micromonospora rubida TaxID=2697657 RepID=A0ABW7SD33_9ACTN
MTSPTPANSASPPGRRGIRVRRLRLVGPERHYQVNFVDRETGDLNSLSVIAGAISTGKSTVLEFIDYCLGASDYPRHPEVIAKVLRAFVELELSGTLYVIERGLGDQSGHVFLRPGTLDDGVGPPVERRPIKPPGSPDSLSSLLLMHCGLEGVQLREAPTQPNSGTDPLSFRDLMGLCFLPNERVASKSLLFETQHMKALKLRQVVNVVFDVHDDRVVDLGQRIKDLETRLARARVAYEAAQQMVEEQRLGGRIELEMARDRAAEELAVLAREQVAIDQRVAAAAGFAEAQRRRHQAAAEEARRADAVLRDRETQLRRMVPLRAQYAADVAKLTMLTEAHQLFDPLQIKVCPACLSALGRTIEVQDGACGLCHAPVADATGALTLGDVAPPAVPEQNGAIHGTTASPSGGDGALSDVDNSLSPFDVSTELRATKARLAELTRFVDDLDAEVSRLRPRVEAARTAEQQAAAEVDHVTTRAISPYLAERDALARRRQDATAATQLAAAGLQMVSSLDRRATEVLRLEAAVKAHREELANVGQDRTDQAAIIRTISDRFAAILADWRYPKLSGAYLNDELIPFVRDLRYTSASSGGRTLISLAWILAIFEVSWESGGSHPGFLFLDSPQKNLGQTGERDTEFADTVTIADFYKHLHKWLAGRGAGTQIIIVDNAPPAEVENDVVVRFSGRADQPPYGLIEDAIA